LNFVFRVDASIQIGTGHVMRCLTLADELTWQGHRCWFVCREHPGNLSDLITSKGYFLKKLPAPAHNHSQPQSSRSENYAFWLGLDWQEDARETVDAITPLKPDWLVVDHYGLNAEWESALCKVVGNIMVIDDLANRPHNCALLLDQNLGRLVLDYDELVPKDCQCLVGPRYALLRPEFAKIREQSLKRRENPELKRILISLGGVDRANVTGQILESLAATSMPTSTELDIIMGASAPYLHEVRKQVDRLPFKATVSVNVKDMAKRMCSADLSIGAAGSTSWERCCMGLPSITVVLAENQHSIAEALAKYGASLLADITRLTKVLPELIEMYASNQENRLLLAQSARKVCDGAGVKRVASALTGEVV